LYRVTALGVPASGASADSAATDAVPVGSTGTAADGTFALFPPGPGTYRVRVGAGALSPALTLAADSSVQRVYAVPLDYAAPLLPAQVDQAARAVPGTVLLRYPGHLQAADVTGCAAIELVVDAAGRTEKGSLRPAAATRPGVRAGRRGRAGQGEVHPGRARRPPVRAVVVVPFGFQIGGRPAPDPSRCEVAGGVAHERIIVTAYRGAYVR
jgi:hypothetical protein